jgi:hypothetical protein
MERRMGGMSTGMHIQTVMRAQSFLAPGFHIPPFFGAISRAQLLSGWPQVFAFKGCKQHFDLLVTAA